MHRTRADSDASHRLRDTRDPECCSKLIAALHCAQQFAKRKFAFAAYDVVNPVALGHVGFGRKAGIVAANHDAHTGTQASGLTERSCSAVLRWKVITERPTTSGLIFAGQLLDRLAHPLLHENQVGDGDVVMRIDIACQRSERSVGHAHRDGGHVLEGVGHGQKENIHGVALWPPRPQASYWPYMLHRNGQGGVVAKTQFLQRYVRAGENSVDFADPQLVAQPDAQAGRAFPFSLASASR